MDAMTRRSVLSGSALALAGGIPLAAGQESGQAESRKKLKLIAFGAHPDDPETGCGGTMLAYADAGHEVVSMYLTRGEAGISGKSHEEAARIRTAELEEACRILGSRPVFVGQIDGASEINSRWYDVVNDLIDKEKPDILLAHWPIDSHRDHRVAGLLAYEAWLRHGKRFALYYFEVYSGGQTQHFWPTHYVDITAVEARKRKACMAHASQHPVGMYAYHDKMAQFRGLEGGYKFAEAHVRHVQNRGPLT